MRKRLQNTRSAVTTRVEGPVDAYVTVGFYEDNQPGEIFIKIAKEGSFLRGVFDVVAIEASLLLQWNVPLSTIVEKWRHIKFDQSEAFEAIAVACLKAVSLMGGQPDKGHTNEEPVRFNLDRNHPVGSLPVGGGPFLPFPGSGDVQAPGE